MRLTDYWMARLMLCSYVLVSTIVTWFDPRATAGILMERSYEVVWWLIPCVAALAVIGLIDVLVNDFMPKSFMLLVIHDHRHLLLIGMAFGSMGISAAIATSDGWSTILLKYWLDSVFAAGLSFLEMFPRHRNHRKECSL